MRAIELDRSIFFMYWVGQKGCLNFTENLTEEHKLTFSPTQYFIHISTHSSIFACNIPWTEEPDGLYSPEGCKESDTTKVTKQQQ